MGPMMVAAPVSGSIWYSVAGPVGPEKDDPYNVSNARSRTMPASVVAPGTGVTDPDTPRTSLPFRLATADAPNGPRFVGTPGIENAPSSPDVVANGTEAGTSTAGGTTPAAPPAIAYESCTSGVLLSKVSTWMGTQPPGSVMLPLPSRKRSAPFGISTTVVPLTTNRPPSATASVNVYRPGTVMRRLAEKRIALLGLLTSPKGSLPKSAAGFRRLSADTNTVRFGAAAERSGSAVNGSSKLKTSAKAPCTLGATTAPLTGALSFTPSTTVPCSVVS
jgi:hypothetical protein